MDELIQPNAGLFSTVLSDLEPSSSETSLNTRATFFKHQGQEISAGRDHRGQPHLLVPLASEYAVQITEQPAKGLRLQITSFKLGEEERFFLDIACLDSNSDDVFGAICNEYCQKISSPLEEGQLLSIFEATIEKWREILRSLTEKEPSENEICGLLGELWLLESASITFGIDAIENWFGPDNSRHDFEFKSRSVEVKTSRSTAVKKIRVHGISQLEAKPGQVIDLVLFQVERSPQGDCVKDIIGRLIEMGVSKVKIAEKLKRFDDDIVNNDPKWAVAFKVSAVSTSVFPVGDEFPILRKTQLDSAQVHRVSGIEYDLRLDGLQGLTFPGLQLSALSETLFL